MAWQHCNDGSMEASKIRVRRSVGEKRRIVELTLEPGQSVARAAQAEGVNANQVFQWRRAYRAGELVEAGERASTLLPVIVAATGSAGFVEQQTTSREQSVPSGAIHIELPGGVAITVEHGADRLCCRRFWRACEVIELRTGTRIWIAAGFTDLRRGFQGLSAQVQTVLEQQPFSGHVFVFRGKRGDTIKISVVRWRWPVSVCRSDWSADASSGRRQGAERFL